MGNIDVWWYLRFGISDKTEPNSTYCRGKLKAMYKELAFSLSLGLPALVSGIEAGPNLKLEIADQELTLEWSVVNNAINYKVYYKKFPSPENQVYDSLDLGNTTKLVAELPYGSKYVIAISAVTAQGETERSSPKTVQIDYPQGTYLENVADPINYNWSGIYSYSGLPSYSFKNSAGEAFLFKQYSSESCWPQGNEDPSLCGHPTASLVYKYNIQTRKFDDVTDAILSKGDMFTIPPLREAVVADFNGDGADDIAFANHGEGTDPYDPSPSLVGDTGWKTANYILLSESDSRYSINLLHTHIDYAHSITASDIDNDGDIDIYMGSRSPIDGWDGDATWEVVRDKSIWNSFDQMGGYFLINNGAGNFSRSDQRLIDSAATLLVDLNNDGVDELVNGIHQRACIWGVCYSDWGVGIYKRDAAGAYNLTQELINPLPYEVQADADVPTASTGSMSDGTKFFLQYINDIQNLDVNNDGLADLIIHTATTQERGTNGAGGKSFAFYSVLINRGGFNFDLEVDRLPLLLVDLNSLFMKVVDMDRDGYPDIVRQGVGGGGGYFSDKISNEIYYNNGFGYFSSVNKLGLPNVSGIADPFDVDGDGDMDMIITTGWDVVYLPGSIASFTTNLWLNE